MQKRKDDYDLDFYRSLDESASMAERLKGRLPIILIAGHPFFVDVHMGLLRPKDNFSTPGLDLNDGGIWNERTKMRDLYYHVPSMTEVKVQSSITELPKDVVLLSIPPPRALDPVGCARMEGVAPTTYTEWYPFRLYTEAKVIPLSETKLAKTVKKNLENTVAKPLRPCRGRGKRH
jgi:hypothetical protein